MFCLVCPREREREREREKERDSQTMHTQTDRQTMANHAMAKETIVSNSFSHAETRKSAI